MAIFLSELMFVLLFIFIFIFGLSELELERRRRIPASGTVQLTK